MSVEQHISNRIDMEKTANYAAILGESPSQGAKSPALWNAAFAGLGLSGIMHPMDLRPDKLADVVEALRADSRFIGGAVTMPYKIDILPLLDELEPEARAIGAVNCLYRKGDKLVGSNTDGAGALWSLEQEYEGDLAGRTVLLLGAGGAALAVAAYVAGALGPEGTLILSNRSEGPRRAMADRLEGRCRLRTVDWPPTPEHASGVDILINCTSLGFETVKTDAQGAYCLRFYTPLGPLDQDLRVEPGPEADKRYLTRALDGVAANHKAALALLASLEAPLVFDIVYQPVRTHFLALAGLLGYPTLSGAAMNLEQAVIAFDKATAAAELRAADQEPVRALMAPLW